MIDNNNYGFDYSDDKRTLKEILKADYDADISEGDAAASTFIMMYDFLLWKFHDINKALIASYIIDVDSYHTTRNTRKKLPFKCTTPYIQYRIPLSTDTINDIIGYLAEEKYIEKYISKRARYIKVNYNKFIQSRNEYKEYLLDKMENENYLDLDVVA